MTTEEAKNRSLTILGFPKCGTSALMRALEKNDNVDVLRSAVGQLEIGWPTIQDIEASYTPTHPVTAHKFTNYIYIEDSIRHLASTPRTFVLCIRNPIKALLSWQNMHKIIAEAGKPESHMAVKRSEFFANCSPEEHYHDFSKGRLQYDKHFDVLMEYVSSDNLVVVRQESLAADIDLVAEYLVAFALAETDKDLPRLDPEGTYVSLADKLKSDIPDHLYEELMGIEARLLERIKSEKVTLI